VPSEEVNNAKSPIYGSRILRITLPSAMNRNQIDNQ